jgi:hypothetical protein
MWRMKNVREICTGGAVGHSAGLGSPSVEAAAEWADRRGTRGHMNASRRRDEWWRRLTTHERINGGSPKNIAGKGVRAKCVEVARICTGRAGGAETALGDPRSG